MSNVIIPMEHQAAPSFRYDKGLARAAEEAAAERPDIQRRRAMRNSSLDSEFDAPAHHDPLLQILEHRALVQRAEHAASAWVEENLEQWELNCLAARKQRTEGQERWQGKENEEMRLVRIMHPHKIFELLRRAGVDARLEEHRNARIWLNEWSAKGLVGINAWVKPQEMDELGYLEQLRDARTQEQKDLLTANFMAAREGRLVRKTITSLQYPYGPEWSIMRFNEYDVATKEKYRGWRTAMLTLIVADVLREEEVDCAFGPAIGPAAEFYRRQCQVWRQIRVGSRPV